MKIGIVGAGTIVPDFLKACKQIEKIQIVAIMGRQTSLEKMQQLSNEFDIENIYTDYQQFLLSDIDVVYIALPNNLHYDFAKEALLEHKHVIVEKPFTSTYEQACELIELANNQQLMIFEAISNIYLPNYIKTKELLSQLGNVKIVQLNYSQYSRRYDLFKGGIVLPVFDPKKAGGALMDLNVYNIHYIVGLFGKPQFVTYSANIEKGIDTSGILLLEYPNFKCVAIGAKDCGCPVSINIQGDQGYVHSDSPANIYRQFIFGNNKKEISEFALNGDKSRLYYELEHFVDVIERKDFEKTKLDNQQTLTVIKILDVARKQVHLEWK